LTTDRVRVNEAGHPPGLSLKQEIARRDQQIVALRLRGVPFYEIGRAIGSPLDAKPASPPLLEHCTPTSAKTLQRKAIRTMEEVEVRKSKRKFPLNTSPDMFRRIWSSRIPSRVEGLGATVSPAEGLQSERLDKLGRIARHHEAHLRAHCH